MKDKLPLLRKHLQRTGVDPDDWMESLFESNVKFSEETNHFLNTCFEAQADLEEVEKLIGDLRQQHSAMVTEMSSTNGSSEKTALLETKLKKKISRVKEHLEEMNEEFKLHERYLSGMESRIQSAQLAALRNNFQHKLLKYNSTLLDHRDHCKQRLQRQLSLSGLEKTNEELDEMIEKGQLTAIVSSQLSIEIDDAKDKLQKVEARHAEIQQLEQSILELYQLFADMALQLSQQDELLDHIEFNVQAAADQLHNALPKLRKAVSYKKSNPLFKLLTCYGAVRFCTVL